jgi:hypothetical protein
MCRIELRKELFRRIEFLNREHEIVEHPRIGIAYIASLILQGWLEREAARREHPSVINRMDKQRANRGSKHDLKLNIESWRLVNQFA